MSLKSLLVVLFVVVALVATPIVALAQGVHGSEAPRSNAPATATVTPVVARNGEAQGTAVQEGPEGPMYRKNQPTPEPTGTPVVTVTPTPTSTVITNTVVVTVTVYVTVTVEVPAPCTEITFNEASCPDYVVNDPVYTCGIYHTPEPVAEGARFPWEILVLVAMAAPISMVAVYKHGQASS